MSTIKNPVTWFEIYVDDMNRARHFYQTVLNSQMIDMPSPDGSLDQMALFAGSQQSEAPNAPGALVKMEGMQAGGNSTIVYFTSHDCAIEQSRVEVAGGQVLKPKFQIGEHGFITLCLDTEGNCFGVHSCK